jgi:SagB-type dehydrogenase family enzyme
MPAEKHMRQFGSARQYHNLTKYKFDDIKSVYTDFTTDSRFETEKSYPNQPVTDLPRDFDPKVKTLGQALSSAAGFGKFMEFSNQEITFQQLSQILFMTNGITSIREFGQKRVYFRASPSASALYPTEIYLYADSVTGLPRGLYYFLPREHQLVKLREGDLKGQLVDIGFNLKSLSSAPAIFIFSGVLDRIKWRFRERALRYALQDAGYVAQNLMVAGSSLDLGVNLIGDFIDQDFNRLLNLTGTSEVALLMASAGHITQALQQDEYEIGMFPEASNMLDSEAPDLSIEAYNKTGHFMPAVGLLSVKVELPFQKTPHEKEAQSNTIKLSDQGDRLKMSAMEAIQNRRSSHNFLRTSVSLEELSVILYRLAEVPALYNYPAYNVYLVVSNVDDLENGIYLYHKDSHALELRKKGTFRGDISYLTLAQDAVFNCSVSIFFSADFDDIDIFSNRGYRYAHLNVGLLSENVYLTATALKLGVRGIGNFFDDNINSFFRVREPEENILGGLIVGHD